MEYPWPVVRVVGPHVLVRAMEVLLIEEGVQVSEKGASVVLILPPCGSTAPHDDLQNKKTPVHKAVRMVGHLDNISDIDGNPPGFQVRALVSSDDPISCVLEALKAVAYDKAYCSPQLLPRILDFLHETVTGESAPLKMFSKETLSLREQEVARAAARGLSNEEIARSLCISVATVKFHLSHIFQKLDVSRRSQISAAIGE